MRRPDAQPHPRGTGEHGVGGWRGGSWFARSRFVGSSTSVAMLGRGASAGRSTRAGNGSERVLVGPAIRKVYRALKGCQPTDTTSWIFNDRIMDTVSGPSPPSSRARRCETRGDWPVSPGVVATHAEQGIDSADAPELPRYLSRGIRRPRPLARRPRDLAASAHRLLAPRRRRLVVALAHQPRPHRIVQFGIGISPHDVLPNEMFLP